MEIDFTQIESLSLLFGALTPFITAVSVKAETPDWFRGIVSMTLAVLAGAIVSYINAPVDETIDLGQTLHNAAATWTTHLLTWLGISSTAVRKLNERTADLGFGRPRLR